MQEPVKILMVCLGNICRSPLAEGILRHKASQAGIACQVDSAGTGGWHIGDPPHPLSQKVARMNEINISGLKGRKFEAADMDIFHRVYFMDSQNLKDGRHIAGKRWNAEKGKLLLEMVPGSPLTDVPDPYYDGFESYLELFDLLSEACDYVLKDISANMKPFSSR
jgi:protein-tyrosine phosphatase